MVSKTLLKLVDEAVLPSFLIIGVKVISIALITGLLNISFYYQNIGVIYLEKFSNVIYVNSYSDLITYSVILSGVVFILIKLLFFTHNKVNPEVYMRLAKHNRLSFIQSLSELYHIFFIWLGFLFLMTIFMLVRSLLLIDYIQLGIIATSVFVFLMFITVKEVEKDLSRR